ncbi:MAG TPA: CYTH and CHAD domain-containing protein [Stellaceae bacterium]|nr:CYTH and CHAD domain-containing protein [Stellaceae bacterium]
MRHYRTFRPREATIGIEIELKLAARARDLPLLARKLRAHARSPADGARFVSTYFDTPDHALARRGMALRVRESGGRFVQTIKADGRGTATPLARGEWEDAITGPGPDPQAPETGRFLGPETEGRLVALFRTEVARQTIALATAPETRIEAAIDRGRIHASVDLSEPISEVELELKSGRPAALYDVAIDLLGVAPLRLERRSKAERGYRLAAPEAAPLAAVHGGAIEFAPDMSGSDVLQYIGLACLDHVMRNEAAALAGLAEAIHQMRVGVRRLRALLTAFGKMLPADQRRWASEELRWLADALGRARNLDVFESALIGPAQKALGDVAGLPALRAAAERRRKAAYIAAAKAIRSTHYTASLLHILRWFETRGWKEGGGMQPLDAPMTEIAARILGRRRRVAKRRGKGFAEQPPAERHRLRIALKKLRYAAEMLGCLYEPEKVAGFTKRLKRLQDDLGDANDVRVGRDILAQLTLNADAGAAGRVVLDWHERRLARREPKLRRRLSALFASEPFWPG